MTTPPTSTSAAFKKLARKLLTTTCLTAVATGAAQATTFNETTDFSNNSATANLLPLGTDRVLGSINPSGDIDFFKLTGLTPGALYSLIGTYEGSARYTVLNSALATLNTAVDNPALLTGTIPGDGMLVVGVLQNEQIAFYDLNLQTSIPEPSTAAGVGLALAGALALRSKQKK